jgi:hypothetical protein
LRTYTTQEAISQLRERIRREIRQKPSARKRALLALSDAHLLARYPSLIPTCHTCGSQARAVALLPGDTTLCLRCARHAVALLEKEQT